MAKSIINYIPADKLDRFNEIIEAAQQAKANAPRAKVARGPMTVEQKRKLAETRLAKLNAMLAALED